MNPGINPWHPGGRQSAALHIRKARPQDMDRVYEIELESFPPEEAATKEKYAWRQEHYPELFLVAEDGCGRICGCICMISTNASLIDDTVFETDSIPNGKTCAILTVMTEAASRRQGVAGQLLEAGIDAARQQNMESVVLTCKEHLVHYYSRFGFEKVGISASVHGGAVWYDMVQGLR